VRIGFLRGPPGGPPPNVSAWGYRKKTWSSLYFPVRPKGTPDPLKKGAGEAGRRGGRACKQKRRAQFWGGTGPAGANPP